MSQKFKVWRTDIGDEAATVEVEAHSTYEAVREVAAREYSAESEDSMEFEIEDSFGQRYVSIVEVEMIPEFDISCRKKDPTTQPDPRGDHRE